LEVKPNLAAIRGDLRRSTGKRNLEGVMRRGIADAEPLAERFWGRLFVAVPASGMVLFPSGRVETNLATMMQAVTGVTERHKRAISPAVFEWTPTGWNKIASVEIKPP
jgi:hypothetical protein